MPYGWQYLVIVLMQAAIIPLVRDPATLPRIPRHPLVGLAPLIAIGGGVVVLGAVPGAVTVVTAVAAFAVPPLALFAAIHVRRAIVPLALLSPVLWLLVWRLPTTPWTQLSGDVLILLAAVSLGRLTGWVAPRPALVSGVLIATIVDVWQVVTTQVQPVSTALAAAVPPRGLPSLQQLEMAGASMGWGDAYLAALVGAIVAASLRATLVATIVTAVAGLAFGLLFNVLDLLPATVPVAVGLIAAGISEQTRVRQWAQTATDRSKRPRMPINKENEPAMATTMPNLDEQLLIGGTWIESTGGARFDVTDPGTGDVVGSVPNAVEADVTAAIDAAAAALPGWRSAPALQRARILRKAADLMRERAVEIATAMTSEQGKPLAEAKGEVEYAASFFEWFAGEAERVYGQVVSPVNTNNRVLVLRQPVGVVAAITPWNFPAAMMTRKLGPAMAAGCTSIVKPASATPLTAALVLRCIEDAGAPAGVVNLITSRDAGMVANTIFTDDRVKKISFTGSTEIGKELIRASAHQVKRLSLELGGHAPYIIFEDADLDEAVEGLIASKYRNAGQTCVCANRAYVQRSVYADFLARLVKRVSEMPIGHGLTEGTVIGPMINEAAVEKAHEHVQDAIAKGAKLAYGGQRLTEGIYATGAYYQPTVIDGVTPEMLIHREETFGPVAGLTAFDTEDEVIELANSTEYGLASYFHTKDYARLLRVAERLEFGIVGANAGIISAANVPFGGVKESGYGREGGSVGIDEYLDVKYVLIGGVGTV